MFFRYKIGFHQRRGRTECVWYLNRIAGGAAGQLFFCESTIWQAWIVISAVCFRGLSTRQTSPSLLVSPSSSSPTSRQAARPDINWSVWSRGCNTLITLSINEHCSSSLVLSSSLLSGSLINKVVWVTDHSLVLLLENQIYYMVISHSAEHLFLTQEILLFFPKTDFVCRQT